MVPAGKKTVKSAIQTKQISEKTTYITQYLLREKNLFPIQTNVLNIFTAYDWMLPVENLPRERYSRVRFPPFVYLNNKTPWAVFWRMTEYGTGYV